MSDPIRDDRQYAFTPSGNGPLTPAMDKWEPFPLPIHEAFQMPPPRTTKPLFVPANICQRVIDSFGKTDAEFAAAIEELQTSLDGGANRNSGNVAPIQWQG